jgi:hypothetical protein
VKCRHVPVHMIQHGTSNMRMVLQHVCGMYVLVFDMDDVLCACVVCVGILHTIPHQGAC